MIELPTESEPVRLVCGDGFAVLRDLPDRVVGHVITDPPYAEKTHAGARTRVLTGRVASAEYAGSVAVVNFAAMTEAGFLDLCGEAVRVARRWVVMTSDWRHALAAEQKIAEFVRFGIWVKPDSAPQFSGDRPGTGWEAVSILHRKGRKRWNGGGCPAVWTHGIERDNSHPAQKPLPLIRRWLKDFTDPGDVVLDPFMGSGTTGVACVQTGRRFIGIELDPEHFRTATKRIDAALGVGGLFAPTAPVVQSMFDHLDGE